MSIDLKQFHQVFFEESLEQLDDMEGALLNLDVEQIDAEAINTIFRAAHSIKGGSATFNFTQITEFTHVLETLLDQIRAEERSATVPMVDLFLQSVDCLREMINALIQDEEPDTTESKRLQALFEQFLAEDSEPKSDEGTAEATASEDVAAETAGVDGWQIEFLPHKNMLCTGNEPSRMFRELAQLGDLQAKIDTSKLVDFDQLDPELCYFSWVLELSGKIELEQVEDVFEWVMDEADIRISPLTAKAAAEPVVEQPSTPTPDESAPAAATPIAASAEPEKVAAKAAPKVVASKDKGESSSIRVAIDKVDALINMVGELVITQSMLGQLGRDFEMGQLDKLQEGLAQLEHNTRELQESVMRIRMLPISFAFNRFPRMVRDLSSKLNKQIELKVSGEQTELDKTVMEKINDPLVHLVRNALDHGLETPEVRRAAGKPETGTLHLHAHHQGGNIVIEIAEDGAGLNSEKILAKAIERKLVDPQEANSLSEDRINELIFLPGFSTADVVSDVSGRGVGMDVVRRNINGLGGSIEVRSKPNHGTTFTIRLPLTLAILDGQLIRVGKHIYIIPLVSIIESLQIREPQVNRVAGQSELYRLREDYVPIIRLYDVFGIRPDTEALADGLLVVVEGDNRRVGLVVDDLLEQQQVVIKSLEANYRRVEGVSGATILGDGTVALILDISGLISLAAKQEQQQLTA